MLLILSPQFRTPSARETLQKIHKILSQESIPHRMHAFHSVEIFLERNIIHIYVDGESIRQYSHIYFRGVGKYASIAQIISSDAKSRHIKVIDRHYAKEISSRIKVAQYYLLAKNGVDFPKTFFSPYYTEKKISDAIQYLKMPIVLKEARSSQGMGIYKFWKEMNMKEKIRELQEKGTQFLLQEFIPNTYDYRILVLGGKARVAEKKTRTRENEFRNNVALGAKEEFLNIETTDKRVLAVAEKAAEITKIDVAGVDVVVDENKKRVCVLEVNSAPQFTINETVSDELIEVIRYLRSSLKK